ncbi:hypothetical protein [Roseateles cavernae]|uniref:hypothetical protein n=1 Tax=Roseateles cavernae TaxID=3153578 RepID=UPI0032E45684
MLDLTLVRRSHAAQEAIKDGKAGSSQSPVLHERPLLATSSCQSGPIDATRQIELIGLRLSPLVGNCGVVAFAPSSYIESGYLLAWRVAAQRDSEIPSL